MSEINFFDSKKNIDPFISETLLDVSLSNRFLSLTEFLNHKKYTYSEKTFEVFQTKIHDRIYSTIKKIAVLHFRESELSGDWGNSGEQQHRISFCRSLLNIPPQKEIEAQHFFKFSELLNDLYETYSINDLTVDQIKQQLKVIEFDLYGLKIKKSDTQLLNRILEFLNLSKKVLSFNYGFSKVIIYGDCKVEKLGDHIVYWVTKEDIRTSTAVMALAALSHQRDIYVRKEALMTVFLQKWCQTFELSEFEERFMKQFDERSISESIKRKAISYFNVNSTQELKNNSTKFLKDVKETVTYHELGHEIIDLDILPAEVGALSEGTKPFGETIYMSLLEVLADFAPTCDGLKGPMQNMIDISKKDKLRAERMFYIYLSDVWFYDTDDKFMYLYSDLMCLILLRYIKDDQQIDFERLEYDITFDQTKPLNLRDKNKLINILLLSLTISTNVLKNLVESSTFEIATGKRDFNQMKKIAEQYYSQQNIRVEYESHKFLTLYWTLFLKQVDLYVPSVDLIPFFDKERQEVMKRLFISCATKKVAESYQYDCRRYIFEKMKSLGFVLDD